MPLTHATASLSIMTWRQISTGSYPEFRALVLPRRLAQTQTALVLRVLRQAVAVLDEIESKVSKQFIIYCFKRLDPGAFNDSVHLHRPTRRRRSSSATRWSRSSNV